MKAHKRITKRKRITKKKLPSNSQRAHPLANHGEVNKQLIIGVVSVVAIIILVSLLFFAKQFVGQAYYNPDTINAGIETLVPQAVDTSFPVIVKANIGTAETVAIRFELTFPKEIKCQAGLESLLGWDESNGAVLETITCMDNKVTFEYATLNADLAKNGEFDIAKIMLKSPLAGEYTLDFINFDSFNLETKTDIITNAADADIEIIVLEECGDGIINDVNQNDVPDCKESFVPECISTTDCATPGTTCELGACVAPTVTCTDTDGGIVINVKGTATGILETPETYDEVGKVVTKEDSCGTIEGDTGLESGTHVVEYNCKDNLLKKQWQPCSGDLICQDGACAEPAEIIEPAELSFDVCDATETEGTKVGSATEDSICAEFILNKFPGKEFHPILSTGRDCLGFYKGIPLVKMTMNDGTEKINSIEIGSNDQAATLEGFNSYCAGYIEADETTNWGTSGGNKYPLSLEAAKACIDNAITDFPFYDASCEVVPECSTTNLELCTTEAECTTVNGVMVDTICTALPESCETVEDCPGDYLCEENVCTLPVTETCSADNLELCTSNTCTENGGTWDNEECTFVDVCSLENPELCLTEPTCTENGGTWDTTEETCTVTPIIPTVSAIKVELLDSTGAVMSTTDKLVEGDTYTVKVSVEPESALVSHLLIVTTNYGAEQKAQIFETKPALTATNVETLEFTHQVSESAGSLNIAVNLWKNWPSIEEAFDYLLEPVEVSYEIQ